MNRYIDADKVEKLLSCGCAYAIRELPIIEVSEDAISRATVLEIYSDLYWIDERLLNFKDELDKVYEKLRTAPSVIPQAKEGETIEKTDVIKAFNECLETSECGTSLNEEAFLKKINSMS